MRQLIQDGIVAIVVVGALKVLLDEPAEILRDLVLTQVLVHALQPRAVVLHPIVEP